MEMSYSLVSVLPPILINGFLTSQQSDRTISISLVFSFRAAWYLLDLYFLPSPQHKVLSLTMGQLIGATVLTVFRQVSFWVSFV